MRLFLLLTALLAASAAAGARELLRDIIHPRDDLPAFRVTLPVTWTSEVDGSGNLQLANADRAASFSLSLAHSSDPAGSLDGLAKLLLEHAVVAPWDSREPAEISGHRGYRYSARVRHSSGAEVRAEIVLVAVGERHVAVCSLLLGERVSRADETLARLVLAAVKLVPVAS